MYTNVEYAIGGYLAAPSVPAFHVPWLEIYQTIADCGFRLFDSHRRTILAIIGGARRDCGCVYIGPDLDSPTS